MDIAYRSGWTAQYLPPCKPTDYVNGVNAVESMNNDNQKILEPQKKRQYNERIG